MLIRLKDSFKIHEYSSYNENISQRFPYIFESKILLSERYLSKNFLIWNCEFLYNSNTQSAIAVVILVIKVAIIAQNQGLAKL